MTTRRLQYTLAAAAGILAAGVLAASPAQANAVQRFDLPQHRVGAVSQVFCLEGLCVKVEIRRLNVTSGKSEICARFVNSAGADWRGGYRLTNRDDPTTFASMKVPAGGEARRCELLPPVDRYQVVLRRDVN